MTDIIEVKGVEYRKVERKAAVGDIVSFADDGPLYLVNKLPTASEDDCLTIVRANQSDLIGHTAFADSLSDVTVYEVTHNPHVEHFAEPMGAEDNVNHPSHYTQGGVEVIDIIAQITRGYTDGFHAYCVGNALKYLARAPYKHATIDEDVRKAAKYIEFITDDKTESDDKCIAVKGDLIKIVRLNDEHEPYEIGDIFEVKERWQYLEDDCGVTTVGGIEILDSEYEVIRWSK